MLITENLRALPYLPYWIIVLVFIQLGLLLYLYLYFPKIILLPFLALIDKRVRRELIESKNAFQNRLLNLIDILFYLNFSFLFFFIDLPFLSLVNSPILYDLRFRDIIIYALILLCVILLSVFKKRIFLFLAYIFNDLERYYVFTFNISMYVKSLGLFLLPIIFFYLWRGIIFDEVLYFILGGIIISYLGVLLTSFFSISQKSFVDYLNFILYFCGLEIIPILIFLKFIRLYSNG